MCDGPAPEAGVGELDIAARAALRLGGWDLVRFGWGARAHVERPVERELVTTVRARDALFAGSLAERRTLFHLEVEAWPRRRTPRRVFEYWAQAHTALATPVRSTVIYHRRGSWRGRLERSYRCTDGAGRRLVFRFDVLPLWKHDVEPVLTRGGPGLLTFVPFLRGATPAHVPRADDQLGAVADERERADLRVSLAVYAARVFPGTNWLGKLPLEELMASSVYRQIIDRGRQEGLQHLRDANLDVVRAKLGRSPRGLAARLAGIDDPERLRRLNVSLATARTAAAVLAALEAEEL